MPLDVDVNSPVSLLFLNFDSDFKMTVELFFIPNHFLLKKNPISRKYLLATRNLQSSHIFNSTRIRAIRMKDAAGKSEQSETTEKIIKYETYRKWPQNPTFSDYFTFLPLNIVHYFSNLSNAFGWKFVTLVGSVYGIQQGTFKLSNLSHLLRNGI
jgi:hypothetical protein